MSKTIIQFVPRLHEGGAEILVCEYCKRLKADGYNVILLEIFPPFDSITYRKIVEMGIPLYYVFPKNNFFYRTMNKYFGKGYVARKLKHIFDRLKPDVIHMHLSWLRFMQELTGYFTEKNIKLVYTCHSIPSYYFSGRKEPEFYAAKKLIQQNAMQLIALTDKMKNELDDMFEMQTTKVVHNAIDVARYQTPMASREEMREQLGISKEEFVVGHVGRFVWQKNHKFILSVFQELIKTKSSKLLFIGDGELKEEIYAEIRALGLSEHVICLSGRTDIPELLSAMDVFIFPSKDEGLGMALVEAQFAGLRCVASSDLPKEVCLTRKVKFLDLDAPKQEWINALLDENYQGEIVGDIRDYEMDNEIKKLKQIYFR